MVTVRGKAEVQAYMASIPAKMEKVLRGAARAAAKVVSDEIKERTPSDDVREGLRTRTSTDGDKIKVRIDVKPGWGRSVGIWLEWGTVGHFISVDDSQRKGRSVRTINRRVEKEDGKASLVIGGKFVGATVWHPGTDPHPVFRPALDTKEAEAIATAQHYINTHVSRRGIVSAEGGDE